VFTDVVESRAAVVWRSQLQTIIAKQEAATARQKAERLAERLRQLGVNPDEAD
jgi:hypothetical protein